MPASINRAGLKRTLFGLIIAPFEERLETIRSSDNDLGGLTLIMMIPVVKGKVVKAKKERPRRL